MTLKKDFYWGNSSSSMQTEGAWNVDGKGPSVYDIREATTEKSNWKDGIDAYHRYEEDIILMKTMGMNMYRFQVSWSRIFPDGDGDQVNQKGIDFYSRLIDACLKHGIEPMICLYHFDMPLSLAEKYNGFLDKHVVDAFVEYSKVTIDTFKDRVKYWITFNEQNLFAGPLCFEIGGYLKGDKTLDELYQIQANVMVAHARVVDYIHSNTAGEVGGMLVYLESYPYTSNPDDVMACRKHDVFHNLSYIECYASGVLSYEVNQFIKDHVKIELSIEELEIIKKQRCDFIAFSYYKSTTIDANKIPKGTAPNYYETFGETLNPHIETSEFGWQIDPMGFRNVINKINQCGKIPVFPIENGIGCKETWDGVHMIEDDNRIDYMETHIAAMIDSVKIDGCNVIGYLGWGLIDILSSSGDMEKRYGLVYVNRGNHDLRDLKRVPKKSFYWMKDVIENNGVNLERKYHEK